VRDILKLILVAAKLGSVLDASKGMLRIEDLDKFEKQGRQTCFVESQVTDV